MTIYGIQNVITFIRRCSFDFTDAVAIFMNAAAHTVHENCNGVSEIERETGGQRAKRSNLFILTFTYWNHFIHATLADPGSQNFSKMYIA